MDNEAAKSLNAAAVWLEELGSEVRQALSTDRTVRFYTLQLAGRGDDFGKPVARVMDFAGGMVVVTWLPPIVGISIYKSIQVMQYALTGGGLYRLEYDDVSERLPPLSSAMGRNFELTKSEKRVVRGILRGLSTKELAAESGTTAATIQSTLHKVFNKLGLAGIPGVRSRFQLLLRAHELDLGTPDYAEAAPEN